MSAFEGMSDADFAAAYKAQKTINDPFGGALAKEGVTGKLADVARSIYMQESGGGKNTKTSNAGAVGGMQIIPSTFASVADKGWDIKDPEQNMRAGIRYLQQLDKQSGGVPELTAAGYYGGPGGMEKARKGIAVSDPRNPNAPTTLQYGQQVAARMPQRPVVDALNKVAGAVMGSANAATPESSKAAVNPFEGMSDADFAAAYKQSKTTPAQPAESGGFMQNVGNAAAGLVRGAGSIGATLLTPIDAAARAVNGGKPINVGGYDIAGQDRRAGMDAGLQSAGAEPDSLMFKGGKLTGEIAGTAGAGGAIANGLLRAAPVVSSIAPAVAKFLTNAANVGGSVVPNAANFLTKAAGVGGNAALGAANFLTKAAPAIQSGGLSLGAGAPTNALANILARTGGGAVNGAVSAGLVNPNDAGTGALFGAALPGAVKLAGTAGALLNKGASSLTSNVLGMATGTGAEAVRTAYQSGKTGATAFLDNMRGNVPMTDVLDSAKSALGQMRLDRAAEYRNGMINISADKSVINFAPIDKAIAGIQSMGNFKGQVINKNSAGVVDEISGLVTQWKGLNPAEYHTPEGLDALKQAISDVRDTTQFGTAARKAADTAYNAVKGEIVSQAPTYAKVMKDYSNASTVMSEVEQALSLGKKASNDTAMRKLQSLMRNNVNTNFGNRLNLAKTLEDNGADLMAPIAGQAMSSMTPRGLAGLTATGTASAAALMTNPLALAALPATSPRIVGEAAYKLGAGVRGVANAGNATSNSLAKILQAGGARPLTFEQYAPLLATAPVLAASQR